VIPLSQIISNVRTRHEAESSIRWADSDIMEAVNDGLDDLSEATRFYERHVSVPIASLRTYYDLRGFLPESALGVTSVWNSVTETWLNPVSVETLGSRWEQAAGPSLSFFMRGLYWMVVLPRAEINTGIFRVYFAAHAPHFTFPQAVLMDLLDDMIPALEEYALYDLAAQDGETSRALGHWSDYTSRVGLLTKFVERRIVTARTMRMGSRK
jgi:hypothetical protein